MTAVRRNPVNCPRAVLLALAGVAITSAWANQGSPPKKVSSYAASARNIYALNWGADEFSARLVESGQLVRFSYRVTDATKAEALNNRSSVPYMLDEHAHAVLQIPEMEKIGPLRQSTKAENGKSYWMTFSNKGNVVKAGHRVSVVIGPFRIDGLVVQ
jgi:hypothetical protein